VADAQVEVVNRDDVVEALCYSAEINVGLDRGRHSEILARAGTASLVR
jgi:hypothetical protein